MQHPLEYASLAPFGFTTPGGLERLNYVPTATSGGINWEPVVARMWETVNCIHLPERPIEMIVHKIMPRLGAKRIRKGDVRINNRAYLSRDILVLSRMVQWFGSHIGGCFLEYDDIRFHAWSTRPLPPLEVPLEEKYVLKFGDREKRFDLVARMLHVCGERCEKVRQFDGSCYVLSSEVSERDRVAVKALMRWLGTGPGQKFIAEFLRLRREKYLEQTADIRKMLSDSDLRRAHQVRR